MKKIEEHRRKYERLRKEKELKKVEQDRQRRQAAQVLIMLLKFLLKEFCIFKGSSAHWDCLICVRVVLHVGGL